MLLNEWLRKIMRGNGNGVCRIQRHVRVIGVVPVGDLLQLCLGCGIVVSAYGDDTGLGIDGAVVGQVRDLPGNFGDFAVIVGNQKIIVNTLQDGENRAILEVRGDYIQGPDGKMKGSRPSGKKRKTKYAPSPQRNHGGIQLGPKRHDCS